MAVMYRYRQVGYNMGSCRDLLKVAVIAGSTVISYLKCQCNVKLLNRVYIITL